MNRRFALEGLLRTRTLQEETAAARLAMANNARLAAVRRLDEGREQIANLGFSCVAGAHAADVSLRASWRIAVAARAAATARLADLARSVDDAGMSAREATHGWETARRERDAVERLRERHAASVIAEELHEEQRALDEAASRRTKGRP